MHVKKLTGKGVSASMVHSLKLNWEDLRYFQALAEKGTLSAAAKMLGVTHVTISRRVQHLELTIGSQLFDQKPSGFELTKSGEKIYQKVSAMAAQAISIQESLKSKGLEGVVRLSATPALCEYIVANGLPEFHNQFPNIKLEVLSEGRNVSLAKHEAHLVLRLTRPEVGEFVIRQIGKMDFGLYHSSEVLEPDFASSLIVGYTEELGHLPEARWLHKEFANNNFVMRSNSLMCQKHAIECGLGIGLLPIYLAYDSERLTRIHSITQTPNRRIWLVMCEAFKDVPRIRIVANNLAEMFKKRRSVFENDV